MEKKTTLILVFLLELLMVLLAALFPFAVYCAWKGYAIDPGNSLKVFTELLSDGHLILINFAIAAFLPCQE